jgi:large subunit ribosomal protein L31e
MSEEAERIYTINLGKVLLSPNNIRAKRAINMIKEFTMHHMKTNSVRISEDVAHYVWKRGIKHPPRKIRVGMERTDEGFVLVYMYDKDEAAADAAPAAVEPTEPELPEQPPSQEGVAELPEPEDLDLRVPDIKTTSQEGVAELPEPEDLDLRVPDIKTTSQEGVAELPEPEAEPSEPEAEPLEPEVEQPEPQVAPPATKAEQPEPQAEPPETKAEQPESEADQPKTKTE